LHSRKDPKAVSKRFGLKPRKAFKAAKVTFDSGVEMDKDDFHADVDACFRMVSVGPGSML
jgi:hypothetical protein